MVAAEDCRGCLIALRKVRPPEVTTYCDSHFLREEGEISGSGLETARPTDWDDMAKASVKRLS